MTCDDVREHLADHVLGALPERTEAEVRRHLRGCMACRRELHALEEGVSTFARAAHQVDPPAWLKDRVLTALEEERVEQPAPVRRPGRVLRVAVAASVAALAGALAWTSVTASSASNRAGQYEAIYNDTPVAGLAAAGRAVALDEHSRARSRLGVPAGT